MEVHSQLNSIRNALRAELSELLWLASIVGSLSVFGVGLAVAFAALMLLQS
jgi:hypothetical protein